MPDDCLKTIAIGTGELARTIAVRQRPGTSPGLFWMGGFKSDMRGTKAAALDEWAAAQGRACTRYDYSGHGESSGTFADGTIGRWLAESLAVFKECCRGPQIAVGSSMGGWLALLLAQALRQEQQEEPQARTDAPPTGTDAPSLAGLVLIAPAVDFTEELMWKKFSPAIRKEIMTTGSWERPSDYGEPYLITRTLIEEGRDHLLLGGMIEVGCPVRILQGVKDPDVPWEHALDLVSRIAQDDVVISMIKDGDHRLSRPDDIERILNTVAEL
jgi:pimeloyl-ACP methyl ester carboxylesterase